MENSVKRGYFTLYWRQGMEKCRRKLYVMAGIAGKGHLLYIAGLK